VLTCFSNEVIIEEPITETRGPNDCDVNSAATETQTQLKDEGSEINQSVGAIGTTIQVILATEQPSSQPSEVLSSFPSSEPSTSLEPSTSSAPSDIPTATLAPSTSNKPSSHPSVSSEPSVFPSVIPSEVPSLSPSNEFNCIDDLSFVIKRGKGRKQVRRNGCEWLAKKPKRCRKSKRSDEYFAKCPLACRTRVCICKDRKSKFEFEFKGRTLKKRCRKIRGRQGRGRFCSVDEVRMQCPIVCRVGQCVN